MKDEMNDVQTEFFDYTYLSEELKCLFKPHLRFSSKASSILNSVIAKEGLIKFVVVKIINQTEYIPACLFLNFKNDP